jgi:hypothetical protein
MERLKPFHVGVAAEAFAAALFAQASCDVSVQYGANQPEYDLLISKGDRHLKISVKGSQDGGWGLCQSFKRGATYQEAADRWASSQSQKVVYCLVQLWGVELGQAPRVYLATVREVAEQMKAARNGHGQTILYENYQYSKGLGVGCNDKLPETWKFSQSRVDQLLQAVV